MGARNGLLHIVARPGPPEEVACLLHDCTDRHPCGQLAGYLLAAHAYDAPCLVIRSAGRSLDDLRHDRSFLRQFLQSRSPRKPKTDRSCLQNVIQSWVTSNIVERKDRADRQRWRLFSLAVTAVLGPGVRTDKYRKGERVLSWKRVLWGTVLPFALLGWCTMNALLWQQYDARYRGGGGIDLGSPRLNSTSRLVAHAAPASEVSQREPGVGADIRVIVLVTSSWTNRSSTNRYSFRETSVRLFPRPSSSITVDYRFLLGTPPSPQTATRAGPGIEAEAEEFGDMLLVPAHDTYEHLSKKIYEGWKWAAGLDVDYVLKTDDDILLRMDVVSKELAKLGRRREYWRGFAYWCVRCAPLGSGKCRPDLLSSAGIFRQSKTPQTRTQTSRTTFRRSRRTPPAPCTSCRRILSTSSYLPQPRGSS